MRIFLLVFLLSGCAPAVLDHGPNQVDAAFQSLYSQFIEDANNNGVFLSENQGIVIEFASLDRIVNPLGETIGECQGIGFGNSTILIDPSYWYTATQEQQKILVYHELGHCVLDEIHIEDPNAIMNAVIDSTTSYLDNGGSWNSLLVELFIDKRDGG